MARSPYCGFRVMKVRCDHYKGYLDPSVMKTDSCLLTIERTSRDVYPQRISLEPTEANRCAVYPPGKERCCYYKDYCKPWCVTKGNSHPHDEGSKH